MRRALGITLGIVTFLGLFIAISALTEEWDGSLPEIARLFLLGALLAPTLALAIRYDVWGYGTLVRRRERRRQRRREQRRRARRES
ncbi:hypothetical protein [Aeromicrobium sp. Root472D3]|uniref:hypothetical protein n=1 Tax=Aeromicrobium sp. Root472D3 TaxID=1736540 RepID=UPI0006F4A4D3|nr:hypothetical protein [Aeromicrobium sp. Root472D3]KQX75604.1 hypothetical protein ASD10_10690 [Aeromicrobium sp. Root472D3]